MIRTVPIDSTTCPEAGRSASSVNAQPQLCSDSPAGFWLETDFGRDIHVRGVVFNLAQDVERELDVYVLTLYMLRRTRLRRVLNGIEETCEVGPGILSLHPPRLPVRWSGDTPLNALHVSFDPGFLQQIALEDVGPGRARTMSIPPALGLEDNVLLQLCGALLEELTPPQPFASARGARAIGEQIALHLLRRYAVFRTGFGKSRAFTPAEVTALHSFVSERLADDIHVAELARVVGMSEHHFFRVFRETFDKTPYDYLQGQRLERAYELLVTTTKSLAEIAELTGFWDHSHLTRCFKRCYDAPPSRFRRGARPPSQ